MLLPHLDIIVALLYKYSQPFDIVRMNYTRNGRMRLWSQ